jgi:hypothetical protein
VAKLGLSETMKAILVVVVPAVVGYVWTSIDTARKDALAYTSRQIEKLYGPLYGLTQASNRIWDVYNKKRDTPEEKEMWRLWINSVFQPINLQIEEVILANSQLIVGNEMPDVFLQAIANTENYKALIARWTAGKFDPDTPLIPYPDQEGNSIIVCVEQTYLALKERQEQLRRWYTRPSLLPLVALAKDCHGRSYGRNASFSAPRPSRADLAEFDGTAGLGRFARIALHEDQDVLMRTAELARSLELPADADWQ